MIKRNTCFLCGIELEPVIHSIARQKHPEVSDCNVVYTDDFGIYVEFDDSINPVEDFPEASSAEPEEGVITLQRYPPVDDVLADIFDEAKLARLGGASSGKGWSSFSLWQRCPRAWRRRYLDQSRSVLWTESPSLAIGTLVHVFLALYYTGMMAEDNPFRSLTPEIVYERLRQRADPAFVSEAWRLFVSYAIYYKHEQIIPLAIEHDLRDPRTGESCRYDLIAYIPEERPGMLAGTYAFEHKTASRFDWPTLNGWQNDGECIGEVALWQRLGLDKRFGELRGLVVNIIGKQKEPRFHRTTVAPSGWQVDQHLRDLTRWEGLISLAKSTNSFPRARGNCIGRYGACDYWDECIDGGAD